MGKYARITQVDLTGISVAAKEIVRNNITDKHVNINTDNRQALISLNISCSNQ